MIDLGNRRFIVTKGDFSPSDFTKSLLIFEKAIMSHPNASFASNEIEYWPLEKAFARSFIGVPHSESDEFYSLDKSSESYTESPLDGAEAFSGKGLLILRLEDENGTMNIKWAERHLA